MGWVVAGVYHSVESHKGLGHEGVFASDRSAGQDGIERQCKRPNAVRHIMYTTEGGICSMRKDSGSCENISPTKEELVLLDDRS